MDATGEKDGAKTSCWKWTASDSIARQGSSDADSRRHDGHQDAGKRGIFRDGIDRQLVDACLWRQLEADRLPKLLIDNQANVLWHSAGAARALRPPLPLQVADGRLSLAAGSGSAAWEAFIDNLGEAEDTMLLSGADEGAWVLVRARAERFDDRRLVFLRCACSWPLHNTVESGLAGQFGLTKSESAVLDYFTRQMRPHQIAAKLQISVSTVRSHLKQIHAKMGVTSSTQLIRLASAYGDV